MGIPPHQGDSAPAQHPHAPPRRAQQWEGCGQARSRLPSAREASVPSHCLTPPRARKGQQHQAEGRRAAHN